MPREEVVLNHVAHDGVQAGPWQTTPGTVKGASSRPTILFVSPVADLKGGAERVLLDLFENPAIRPALAVPGEGDLAAIARSRGYPVRFFDLGSVASVRRPPRPADLAGAARAGLRCARQLAQASREPVVAHLHEIAHTRLEKAIWRGVAAAVTRTIVVSAPCYPAASLPAGVAVVSNGVRDPMGSPAPRALSETPTIGFVGRFHPFKGIHLLLDWFEHASRTRPALRLLIRGRADAEGAPYWEALQDRIRPLVGQGRCRVLGWAEAGEDPYAGIDILAVPSQTPDPAPLVILEAMLRGLPVIGYPAGGVPFLVGAPACGALASDAAGFGAALDRLLVPDAYRAASLAGAARVRETFTIERFWDAIAAQYALAGVPVPPRPS